MNQSPSNSVPNNAADMTAPSADNTAPVQTRVMDIPGTAPFVQPRTPQPAARPANYYGSSYPVMVDPALSAGSAALANAGRRLVIGEGITLAGEIEACDHLVIEGTVEAALKGAKVLDVSQSGVFYGTVEIDEATIAGRFEGDLTVNGRLTIRSTGSVVGTVSYKELSVEAGALVEGRIAPVGSANNAADKSPKKQPVSNKNANRETSNLTELPFAPKAAVGE